MPSFLYSRGSRDEFDEPDALLSRIFPVLLVYSLVSLLFRFGWVLPCVIVGALAGMLSDDVVHLWDVFFPVVGRWSGMGGEPRMVLTVTRLWEGFAVGLLMGVALDFYQRHASRQLSNSHDQKLS